MCECARANDSQVTQPQGKASGRRPYIRDACWDLPATHPRRAAGERPFRCHSCAAVRSLCMRLRAPVRLALLLCIAWPAGWCARGMLSVLRDAVPGCGGALRNVREMHGIRRSEGPCARVVGRQAVQREPTGEPRVGGCAARRERNPRATLPVVETDLSRGEKIRRSKIAPQVCRKLRLGVTPPPSLRL